MSSKVRKAHWDTIIARLHDSELVAKLADFCLKCTMNFEFCTSQVKKVNAKLQLNIKRLSIKRLKIQKALVLLMHRLDKHKIITQILSVFTTNEKKLMVTCLFLAMFLGINFKALTYTYACIAELQQDLVNANMECIETAQILQIKENVIEGLEIKNDELEETNDQLMEDNVTLQKTLDAIAYLPNDSEVVKLIKTKSIEYGLDKYLAVAIARHETGNFTSGLWVSYYNPGGLRGSGSWCHFSTAEEGVEAYCKTLKWYKDKGMDSIESMAYTYCGSGAPHWIECVRYFYNEEKAKVS